METIVFTASAFGLVVLIMSVGVIFKRKPIQGSCGGIASVMGLSGCDICEKKNQCKKDGRKLCDDE